MPKVWSQAPGSQKWHLFRTLGYLSLCRRFRVNEAEGEQEDAKTLEPKPYDCKACVKEYNRIKAEARK